MSVSQHDLAQALLSHAYLESIGEQVSAPEVETTIIELGRHPSGRAVLRRALVETQLREAIPTVEDWMMSAKAQRAQEARIAAGPIANYLAPLQAVALTAAATATILSLAGTLTAATGVAVVLLSTLAAIAASFLRWRFSQRENMARTDVDLIDNLLDEARKHVAK